MSDIVTIDLIKTPEQVGYATKYTHYCGGLPMVFEVSYNPDAWLCWGLHIPFCNRTLRGQSPNGVAKLFIQVLNAISGREYDDVNFTLSESHQLENKTTVIKMLPK